MPAKRVDSFIPLIRIKVERSVKKITGKLIAKGILSKIQGILSCTSSP